MGLQKKSRYTNTAQFRDKSIQFNRSCTVHVNIIFSRRKKVTAIPVTVCIAYKKLVLDKNELELSSGQTKLGFEACGLETTAAEGNIEQLMAPRSSAMSSRQETSENMFSLNLLKNSPSQKDDADSQIGDSKKENVCLGTAVNYDSFAQNTIGLKRKKALGKTSQSITNVQSKNVTCGLEEKSAALHEERKPVALDDRVQDEYTEKDEDKKVPITETSAPSGGNMREMGLPPERMKEENSVQKATMKEESVASDGLTKEESEAPHDCMEERSVPLKINFLNTPLSCNDVKEVILQLSDENDVQNKCSRGLHNGIDKKTCTNSNSQDENLSDLITKSVRVDENHYASVDKDKTQPVVDPLPFTFDEVSSKISENEHETWTGVDSRKDSEGDVLTCVKDAIPDKVTDTNSNDGKSKKHVKRLLTAKHDGEEISLFSSKPSQPREHQNVVRQPLPAKANQPTERQNEVRSLQKPLSSKTSPPHEQQNETNSLEQLSPLRHKSDHLYGGRESMIGDNKIENQEFARKSYTNDSPTSNTVFNLNGDAVTDGSRKIKSVTSSIGNRKEHNEEPTTDRKELLASVDGLPAATSKTSETYQQRHQMDLQHKSDFQQNGDKIEKKEMKENLNWLVCEEAAENYFKRLINAATQLKENHKNYVYMVCERRIEVKEVISRIRRISSPAIFTDTKPIAQKILQFLEQQPSKDSKLNQAKQCVNELATVISAPFHSNEIIHKAENHIKDVEQIFANSAQVLNDVAFVHRKLSKIINLAKPEYSIDDAFVDVRNALYEAELSASIKFPGKYPFFDVRRILCKTELEVRCGLVYGSTFAALKRSIKSAEKDLGMIVLGKEIFDTLMNAVYDLESFLNKEDVIATIIRDIKPVVKKLASSSDLNGMDTSVFSNFLELLSSLMDDASATRGSYTRLLQVQAQMNQIQQMLDSHMQLLSILQSVQQSLLASKQINEAHTQVRDDIFHFSTVVEEICDILDGDISGSCAIDNVEEAATCAFNGFMAHFGSDTDPAVSRTRFEGIFSKTTSLSSNDILLSLASAVSTLQCTEGCPRISHTSFEQVQHLIEEMVQCCELNRKSVEEISFLLQQAEESDESDIFAATTFLLSQIQQMCYKTNDSMEKVATCNHFEVGQKVAWYDASGVASVLGPVQDATSVVEIPSKCTIHGAFIDAAFMQGTAAVSKVKQALRNLEGSQMVQGYKDALSSLEAITARASGIRASMAMVHKKTIDELNYLISNALHLMQSTDVGSVQQKSPEVVDLDRGPQSVSTVAMLNRTGENQQHPKPMQLQSIQGKKAVYSRYVNLDVERGCSAQALINAAFSDVVDCVACAKTTARSTVEGVREVYELSTALLDTLATHTSDPTNSAILPVVRELSDNTHTSDPTNSAILPVVRELSDKVNVLLERKVSLKSAISDVFVAMDAAEVALTPLRTDLNGAMGNDGSSMIMQQTTRSIFSDVRKTLSTINETGALNNEAGGELLDVIANITALGELTKSADVVKICGEIKNAMEKISHLDSSDALICTAFNNMRTEISRAEKDVTANIALTYEVDDNILENMGSEMQKRPRKKVTFALADIEHEIYNEDDMECSDTDSFNRVAIKPGVGVECRFGKSSEECHLSPDTGEYDTDAGQKENQSSKKATVIRRAEVSEDVFGEHTELHKSKSILKSTVIPFTSSNNVGDPSSVHVSDEKTTSSSEEVSMRDSSGAIKRNINANIEHSDSCSDTNAAPTAQRSFDESGETFLREQDDTLRMPQFEEQMHAEKVLGSGQTSSVQNVNLSNPCHQQTPMPELISSVQNATDMKKSPLDATFNKGHKLNDVEESYCALNNHDSTVEGTSYDLPGVSTIIAKQGKILLDQAGEFGFEILKTLPSNADDTMCDPKRENDTSQNRSKVTNWSQTTSTITAQNIKVGGDEPDLGISQSRSVTEHVQESEYDKKALKFGTPRHHCQNELLINGNDSQQRKEAETIDISDSQSLPSKDRRNVPNSGNENERAMNGVLGQTEPHENNFRDMQKHINQQEELEGFDCNTSKVSSPDFRKEMQNLQCENDVPDVSQIGNNTLRINAAQDGSEEVEDGLQGYKWPQANSFIAKRKERSGLDEPSDFEFGASKTLLREPPENKPGIRKDGDKFDDGLQGNGRAAMNAFLAERERKQTSEDPKAQIFDFAKPQASHPEIDEVSGVPNNNKELEDELQGYMWPQANSFIAKRKGRSGLDEPNEFTFEASETLSREARDSKHGIQNDNDKFEDGLQGYELPEINGFVAKRKGKKISEDLEEFDFPVLQASSCKPLANESDSHKPLANESDSHKPLANESNSKKPLANESDSQTNNEIVHYHHPEEDQRSASVACQKENTVLVDPSATNLKHNDGKHSQKVKTISKGHEQEREFLGTSTFIAAGNEKYVTKEGEIMSLNDEHKEVPRVRDSDPSILPDTNLKSFKSFDVLEFVEALPAINNAAIENRPEEQPEVSIKQANEECNSAAGRGMENGKKSQKYTRSSSKENTEEIEEEFSNASQDIRDRVAKKGFCDLHWEKFKPRKTNDADDYLENLFSSVRKTLNHTEKTWENAGEGETTEDESEEEEDEEVYIQEYLQKTREGTYCTEYAEKGTCYHIKNIRFEDFSHVGCPVDGETVKCNHLQDVLFKWIARFTGSREQQLRALKEFEAYVHDGCAHYNHVGRCCHLLDVLCTFRSRGQNWELAYMHRKEFDDFYHEECDDYQLYGVCEHVKDIQLADFEHTQCEEYKQFQECSHLKDLLRKCESLHDGYDLKLRQCFRHKDCPEYEWYGKCFHIDDIIELKLLLQSYNTELKTKSYAEDRHLSDQGRLARDMYIKELKSMSMSFEAEENIP